MKPIMKKEVGMSKIKAVVYGVGAMNAIITRMMLEKGVEIVGAISRSPKKAGKDLGELIGLGQTLGVTVNDDPAAVLSQGADIAVIAINSYMQDAQQQLRLCAEHGVNAVTLSEEAIYPWDTSPQITKELDSIAKHSGVTLTGSGHQDAYWVNMVRQLMGTAHHIESVTGHASWNVDDYGPEVAKDQQVGTSPEAFVQWLESSSRPPTFGRNVLDALVASLDLTPSSVTTKTKPVIADQPLPTKSLGITVPAGAVAGFTDIDEIETQEGIRFIFEMTGRVYRTGESDINHWQIAGEPTLELNNGAVPTQITTCCQLVNRIPDVINAPAGFVTVEKLPLLSYRAFDLDRYLTS
jgi:4-hydroxy-tetrahydrodipicolinate reductase